MNIFCFLKIHRWKWFSSVFPYVVIYRCEFCGKEKEDYQGQ